MATGGADKVVKVWSWNSPQGTFPPSGYEEPMEGMRLGRHCMLTLFPVSSPSEKMEPKCTLYGSNASIMSVQFDQLVSGGRQLHSWLCALGSNSAGWSRVLSLTHTRLSFPPSLSPSPSLPPSLPSLPPPLPPSLPPSLPFPQSKLVLAASNDYATRIWTFHDQRPKV